MEAQICGIGLGLEFTVGGSEHSLIIVFFLSLYFSLCIFGFRSNKHSSA